MNQANLLFSSMAQAIGHTIVLSLAQTFIIFICLRIILKLIPHSASNIKYNLAYCGYMAMGVWFIVTLGHQYSMAHAQLNFVYTAGIPSHDILSANAGPDPSVLFSISFLNEYLPLIAAFYVLGIGWYALRFLLNFIKINQLKSTEIIELDFHWQQNLRRLASYMDIKVPLQAFFSSRVNTPMMIGFIKPVILLPFSAMSKLSNEQFEAILLHELAHIRRNDYLLNIIQSAFDIILFFNPFAWWVTKYIREEREKSCDEMVVQYSTPFHYARALLSLEEPLKKQALVMTAVSKRSYLLHRIKNIMEMKNNQLGLRQKLITLLIISIATISVAWLSPSTSPAFQKNISKIKPKDRMKATAPLFFNSMNFWPASDSLPENVAPVPPKAPAPPVAAVQGKMPPPPPSPLAPPTPPAVPAPPMPGMAPLPPAPLPPSLKNDSLPPMMNYFDSKAWKQQQKVIKKNAEQMHKFFESDAWKKQQQAIKKSAEQMQKYFESDAWKKQQDLLRENAIAMQKYFDSPEWKKQQELIQENAGNMKKYFNSPQWKKQQELLKMNSEKIKKYFDSPEWKKQQELLKKNAEKTQEYFKSPEWKKQQEQWQHFGDSLFNNPQNKPAQNSLQNLQHSIEKIQQNLSIRQG